MITGVADWRARMSYINGVFHNLSLFDAMRMTIDDLNFEFENAKNYMIAVNKEIEKRGR